MESGGSSYSLSSRRQSELGSHYMVESGVYMSSFAATIFIAALVTIGVLLLTLLVALTVMLESCQNRNSGVFELVKTSDQYDYCNLLAFHAELNSLKVDEFPSVCKLHALKYITEGGFLRDLNLTVQIAESYFSTQTPDDDSSDVILMDVDDLFLSDITYSSNIARHWRKQIEDMTRPAHMLVHRLYMKLQSSGWSLILFTRKPLRNSNTTIENLIYAGYGGWSSLIMRSEAELKMESWEYLSGRRLRLQSQGFRIASVISSQMDALQGPYLGKQNFKLANPIYFKFEQSEGLVGVM